MADTQQSSTFTASDLRRHVSIIRRRFLWIAVPALLLVVAWFTFTPRSVEYVSVSRVRLPDTTSLSVFSDGLLTPDQISRNIAVQEQLATSPAVESAVETEIGDDKDDVIDFGVSTDENGFEMQLSVTATNPDSAEAAATAYAEAYVTVQQQESIRSLEERATQLSSSADLLEERDLADLTSRAETIQSQLAITQGRIDAAVRQGGGAEAGVSEAEAAPALVGERDNLQLQVDNLSLQVNDTLAQISTFRTTAQRLRIDAEFRSEAGASIISTGSDALGLGGEIGRRELIGVVVIATALGLVVGYAIEQIDDRVTEIDDVGSLAGAEVIGAIPRRALFQRQPEFLTTSQHGQLDEAFTAARTNFLVLAEDRGASTFAITSPSSQDGRSSTVANLGISLARYGAEVLVLSGDLRRPALADHLDAPTGRGLTSILLEGASVEEVRREIPIRRATGSLDLISAGPVPENPAEVLGSPDFSELFDRLASTYDFVLVDTPPLLAVADGLVITQIVDSVLMLSRLGHTREQSVVEASARLQTVRTPADGSIVLGAARFNNPYIQ